MTSSELENLFSRIVRLHITAQERVGDGIAWDYTFENGETIQYEFKGIRNRDEVQDAISNLLIWIWNAKDHLKERATALGQDGQLVETTINSETQL